MATHARRGPAAAFFCLLTAIACAWVPVSAGAAELDDTARVIAGIALGDAKSDYAKEVSSVWSAYERRIGQPMRQWACKEVPQLEGGTVFYPFSGPDLPAIVQMFPEQSHYVLVATQRGEPPPFFETFSRAELEQYL